MKYLKIFEKYININDVHICINTNSIDCFKKLLVDGLDLSNYEIYGELVLNYAIKYESNDIVKYIIDNDLVNYEKEHEGQNAFTVSIMYSNTEIFDYLIDKVDLELEIEEETPIEKAVDVSMKYFTRELLKKGVDVNRLVSYFDVGWKTIPLIKKLCIYDFESVKLCLFLGKNKDKINFYPEYIDIIYNSNHMYNKSEIVDYFKLVYPDIYNDYLIYYKTKDFNI